MAIRSIHTCKDMDDRMIVILYVVDCTIMIRTQEWLRIQKPNYTNESFEIIDWGLQVLLICKKPSYVPKIWNKNTSSTILGFF